MHFRWELEAPMAWLTKVASNTQEFLKVNPAVTSNTREFLKVNSVATDAPVCNTGASVATGLTQPWKKDMHKYFRYIYPWFRNITECGTFNHHSLVVAARITTYLGHKKMDNILETKFSNQFLCMKIAVFWFDFHWSLLLWVQSTMG